MNSLMRGVSQMEPSPTVVVMRNSPDGFSFESISRVLAAASLVKTSCAVRYSTSPCSVRMRPRAWRWNSDDVEVLFQRADLPADGRLRQCEFVARMGEAAGVRHGVKDPELVPIHGSYSAAFWCWLCWLCSQRSASSAAMQPMPAAVTAWR